MSRLEEINKAYNFASRTLFITFYAPIRFVGQARTFLAVNDIYFHTCNINSSTVNLSLCLSVYLFPLSGCYRP